MKPPAPKNVRVVGRDGTVTRVQVFYSGQTDDGTHMWCVAGRFPLRDVREVLFEEMPPRSTITFRGRD